MTDMTELDHDAILDAMADAGLAPSWEYPGCAVIEVTLDLHVWTGLHGYEYGSLVDGEGNPVEQEICEPEDVYEDSTPEQIAQGWARWVFNRRHHPPLPCGCMPHVTRRGGFGHGLYCETEQQAYCNFECPHEEDDDA